MKLKLTIAAACMLIPLLFTACFGEEQAEKPKEEKKAVKRVIVTQKRNTRGKVTVYAENEKVFEYAGTINIKSDGMDGEPVEIVVDTDAAGTSGEN